MAAKKKTMKKYGVEASKKLSREVQQANKSAEAKKRIAEHIKLVMKTSDESEVSFIL